METSQLLVSGWTAVPRAVSNWGTVCRSHEGAENMTPGERSGSEPHRGSCSGRRRPPRAAHTLRLPEPADGSECCQPSGKGGPPASYTKLWSFILTRNQTQSGRNASLMFGERLHQLRNVLGSLHLGQLRWECPVTKDGRALWGPPSSCLCDPNFSSRTVESVPLIQDGI